MSHMPQRMPWVVEESLFIEKCTRCEKCVSACETAIIVKGSGGFPEVDFQLGECTFCGKCAEVCTDSTFRLVTEPPWQQTVAIDSSCLALKGIECRSCSDSCESRAIRFEMQLGGVATPKIIKQDCNGCGACISPCPVDALDVQPN